MDHWEQRSRDTREANQLIRHQLEMQMEDLKSQKEQEYIKQKVAEVKREQEQQAAFIEQQKREHEAEVAMKQQLESEKARMDRERQERVV